MLTGENATIASFIASTLDSDVRSRRWAYVAFSRYRVVAALKFNVRIRRAKSSFARKMFCAEPILLGKGLVTKCRRLRRANHWLDCLYTASAAAHLAGARLIRDTPPPPPPARRRVSTYEGHCREDGRPWVDLERWREIRDW